jgi:hypothetical protein
VFFAHGFSAYLDAVGIVHQAVQDAVGDGGVADLLLPARDRQLGSEDGGASLVAIVADLPELGGGSHSFSGAMAQSLMTRTSMRLSRAKKGRKLPSARARASSRDRAAARR